MTRKDYQLIAQALVIAEGRDASKVDYSPRAFSFVRLALADAIEAEHPSFDRERFLNMARGG